uniref:Wzz/FepE/Etk N-terminal domain-containing protein n=1 Tax=Erwinia sp. E_sp_W01_6 TaxID=3039408 RepID=UPI00403FB0D2
MSNENQSIRAGSTTSLHSGNSTKEGELDLLDVVYQIWNGRKTIIISILVALIIAALYLLLLRRNGHLRR